MGAFVRQKAGEKSEQETERCENQEVFLCLYARESAFTSFIGAKHKGGVDSITVDGLLCKGSSNYFYLYSLSFWIHSKKKNHCLNPDLKRAFQKT